MGQFAADIYFLILTSEDGKETVYSDHKDRPAGFTTSEMAMAEGKEIVDHGAAASHAAINLQAMIAHAKRWIERDK